MPGIVTNDMECFELVSTREVDEVWRFILLGLNILPWCVDWEYSTSPFSLRFYYWVDRRQLNAILDALDAETIPIMSYEKH